MPAIAIFVKSLAFGLSQKRSVQAGREFSKTSVVSGIEDDHRHMSSDTSPYKFPPRVMPESETRLITLTEDELQRMVERGANLGGQEAISSLEDKLRELERKVEQLAITQKLVPEHVLLSWLDVSRKTLKRWDVPVDSKQGQTRFYHMTTVIGHLRGNDEDEEGGTERKYTLKVTE